MTEEDKCECEGCRLRRDLEQAVNVLTNLGCVDLGESVEIVMIEFFGLHDDAPEDAEAGETRH